MQFQSNISDSQRLQEIKGFLNHNREIINKAQFNDRLLLLEVYEDELWRLDTAIGSFKAWVESFTEYNYSTVQNWVWSDGIRSKIQELGLNATKWSDASVLELTSVDGTEYFDDIVLDLPENPTREQVRAAIEKVKPSSNVLPFRGSASPTSKKQSTSSIADREAQEILRDAQRTIAELKEENTQLRIKKPSSVFHVQKDTVLEEITSESDATADLQALVATLQQQIDEAAKERTDLMALMNAQAEELNRLSRSQPTPTSEDDDFGTTDKDKIIAKQARQIENLQAQVERLNQQLSDRASGDLEKQLNLARGQIKYYSDILDGIDNAELLEKITNNAPKDDASLLQFELNRAIESLDKQTAIILDLEKKNKELQSKALKVDDLERSVTNLREMLGTPAPKQINSPAKDSLPEVILEAIANCEKHNYQVMVNCCPEGFAVVTDSGSTVFADDDDVLDYLYGNLDQYVMTA